MLFIRAETADTDFDASDIRAGRAQPDNREGDESCLAVLNNFYNDGVR